MITVLGDAPEENKAHKERVYRATRGNYIFEPSENRRFESCGKRKKGLIFGAVCKGELMAGFSPEVNILTLAAYKRA